MVPRDEAVARVRAACDARDAIAAELGAAGAGGPSDAICVVARTDARQAEGIDEALARVRAFAEAGADVLFVDALESEAEMMALCEQAPHVPKMANNLEGGGKTPLLPRSRLAELGFAVVAYPLSVMGGAMAGMELALDAVEADNVPAQAQPSLQQIREAVQWPQHDRLAERYATPGVAETPP